MTARRKACVEVCFVIGRGGAILWADASDSAEALPDSRARWEAIWRHRGELEAIAHSHPVGPAAFSAEDESTMQAIDGALGRELRYYVVAPRHTIARTGERAEVITPEPWWAGRLRLASGMVWRSRWFVARRDPARDATRGRREIVPSRSIKGD